MRNIIWLFVIILFAACSNNDTVADAPGDTAIVNEEDIILPPEPLPWVSDFDTVKNEFFLRQQRQVNKDSLSAEAIINDINAVWDGIKLEYVKTSGDTIYVAIPDNSVLGQQMGSAGAAAYMASTTYNLTELKGVNYVNFQMPTTDHVSGGVYSRKSFENYR